jgi:transcriptional regulator with XRE-family HTH domain
MLSHMASKQDGDRFGQVVAAQVRAEIAAAEESVASIARKTGINRETLDRWVKGERALSVPTLYRIAAALNIAPHTIVLRAEERFGSSGGGGLAPVTPLRPTSDVGDSGQDLAEVAYETEHDYTDDTDDKYIP